MKSWAQLKITKGTVLLFGCLFVLLMSISVLLYGSKLSFQPIRSDGKGYYLYLPAAVTQRDFTMHWNEPSQPNNPDPAPTAQVGLATYPHNKHLDKYPMGVAMMQLPFFLVAHIMTLITGEPANGFSGWYKIGVLAAAAFYASLGAAVLYRVLRRYFTVGVSFAAVFTLVLGTNFINYATHDASFSHVFSFCLVAIAVWLIPLWYANRNLLNSAALGALFGLIGVVRPTNLLLVLLFLLWGVNSQAQLRERLTLWWAERKKLILAAAAAFIVFLPQLIYWHYITGKWIVFSYRGESFNFMHPQIIKILFSTDRGVFFWAPLLLLSLVGLLWLRKQCKEWSTAVFIFLPVWLWVVSSWHSWQYGMSFGHRAFIDIFPLLALPLASLYAMVSSKQLIKLLMSVVVLGITANLFLSYLYWILGVPGSDTTLSLYGQIWHNGLWSIYTTGLSSGVLGLIGIVIISLLPLGYYLLQPKLRQQD